MKFNVLLLDPPWHFRIWGKSSKKAPECHYQTLSLDDIKSLDIKSIADDDCCLFLWTTGAMIPDALECLKAWDFKFSTMGFIWTKPQISLGYWTRAQSEFCLLATRGHPKRISRAVRQHLHQSRTKHSEKPVEIHNRIVTLCGDVSRIELFARAEPPEGWLATGLEYDGRDIREALNYFSGLDKYEK